MRIGRGHRNFRQVQLVKELERTLGRSYINKHYGYPNISTIRDILAAEKELLYAGRSTQFLHRSTKDWKNYGRLFHIQTLSNGPLRLT